MIFKAISSCHLFFFEVDSILDFLDEQELALEAPGGPKRASFGARKRTRSSEGGKAACPTAGSARLVSNFVVLEQSATNALVFSAFIFPQGRVIPKGCR